MASAEISQVPEAVGLEGVDWGWLCFGFLFAQNLGDGEHSVKHWRRKGIKEETLEAFSSIMM